VKLITIFEKRCEDGKPLAKLLHVLVNGPALAPPALSYEI